MTQQELNDLIDKVNNGTATAEDLRLYTTYLNHITSGDEAWDVQALGTEESVKQELHNRIELIRKPVEVKKVNLWPRIVAVAAAVAAIVFGIWLYNYEVASSRKAPRNDVAYKNDIAPGKNTATLTLPNGSTIPLSDAKTGVVINATKDDATQLKYNDGSLVRSSLRGGTTRQPHDEIASIPRNDGMMLTAATPRGGTYQITLPDGTQVWLNAESKISFPSQFSGTNRKILLSGEAYFEVAKNKAQPFIVASEGQEVTVLGTHFNINAYSDEGNTKTTLLEGSVRVSSLPAPSLRGGTTRQPPNEMTLKPNQQASLIGGHEIKVTQADIEAELSWKNGYFRFNQQGIQDIMRKLSRWYNIDVLYQGKITTEKFTGTVSRDKNISEALLMLEQTKGVHFKIEGRTITVIP